MNRVIKDWKSNVSSIRTETVISTISKKLFGPEWYAINICWMHTWQGCVEENNSNWSIVYFKIQHIHLAFSTNHILLTLCFLLHLTGVQGVSYTGMGTQTWGIYYTMLTGVCSWGVSLSSVSSYGYHRKIDGCDYFYSTNTF